MKAKITSRIAFKPKQRPRTQLSVKLVTIASQNKSDSKRRKSGSADAG
jgi:hypothetical protein